MHPQAQQPAFLRRAVAVFFFAVGLGALILVALIVWKGGRWTVTVGKMVFSAANPRSRLLLAAVALLAGRLIWSGAPRRRKQWVGLVGKCVLLAISLAISWSLGERILQRVMRAHESSGSLQQLDAFNKGADIDVQDDHALAAIVRVSPNRMLAYELKPDLDMAFGGWILKTNADGMRENRDYAREKPARTLRIIGLGDSGMFGWACHQGENYLDFLEENLNRRPDPLKYEVLNLAVPGYNTFQEVELLRYKGLAYSPDIVILSWCDNDLLPPFFLHKHRDYRESDVSYLYLLLFDRAEFGRRTQPEVMRGDEVDPRYVDPRVLEYSGHEGVLKSLRELKQLAAAQDFRVLVTGPVGSRLAQVCEQEGIACWSVYSLRQEDYPDANIHGMHPRPKANRILAEFLEKELDRRGWLGLHPAGGRGQSTSVPAPVR